MIDKSGNKIVLSIEIEGIEKQQTLISLIDAKLKQLNQTRKELLNTAKQDGAMTAQNLNQMQKVGKEIQGLNEMRRKEVASSKDVIRQQLAQTGSINGLRARLAELRKTMGDLDLGTTQGRKKLSELRQEYDKGIQKVRDFDRAMSGSKTLVGEYAKGFNIGIQNIAKGAVALLGVRKSFDVMRDMFNIYKDFDQNMARLAGILSTTKDNIISLNKQARELGATTIFTASQIVEMQTELAKLGFGRSEIEASTKAVTNLAAVANYGIAESAKFSGAVLRMYGLNANEMQRVADVMGKSTTTTALTMEKLAGAFPYVGAAANVAGVSLERTTALLGVLANRGIEASMSGTSLRNMFVELQRKGLTWDQAMNRINKSTNQSATAFELFGKRSMSAALILSKSEDEVKNLTAVYENSTGAVEEMAKVMLDNVQGDLTIARSAWESFVLSIEDGNGEISEAVRGSINLFTDLVTILRKANEGQSLYMQKIMKQSDVDGQIKQRMKDDADKVNKALETTIEEEEKLTQILKTKGDNEYQKAKVKLQQEKATNEAMALRTSYLQKIRGVTYQITGLEKETGVWDTENKDKLERLKIDKLVYEQLAQAIEDKYLPAIKKQKDAIKESAGQDAASLLLGDGDEGTITKPGKEQQLLKKKLKDQKDLYFQMREMQINAINDKYQREEEALDLWYEKEKAKIEESTAGQEYKDMALSALDIEYYAKRGDLGTQDLEKTLENAQKHLDYINNVMNPQQLVATTELYENINKERKKEYSQEIKDKEELEKDKEKIVQQSIKSLSNLAKSYTDYVNAKMDEELSAAGDNEAKKEEIRRKYAKQRQLMAISEIIIDGAKGVAKIWADWGWPLGLVFSAIEAAAIALQISTVRKQKFATGGLIKSGSELPGSAPNTDNTLILAKPGEVVLNQDQQKRAGGVDFFRRLGVPGFATGGLIGIPEQADPSSSMTSMVNGIGSQLREIRVMLNINELHDAENELAVVSKAPLI